MNSLTTHQLPQDSIGSNIGQLTEGHILQGRYQVMGVLGTGGMGSVYQARDLRFTNVTKLCAIKEMLNQDSDAKRRELKTKNFEREANILATLNHPAVPEIFDYFSEGDRSFLVMEYISGNSLDFIMQSRNDLLDEIKVLDWALQICDVLAYLHTHDPEPIIFRDLKPSNIMLDTHNHIRMIDFGIAKVFETGQRGTMIGTEGFSPPEQYRGEANPSSDVYSLGATLHALLSGTDPRNEPPFSHTDRPIQSYRDDISPAFVAIVTKALSYDSSERFDDGSKMLLALQSVAQGFSGKDRQLRKSRFGTGPLVAAYTINPNNVEPVWVFRCDDEIRSTPHIADDKVYIGSYDKKMYSLSVLDGTPHWEFVAKDGIASSPLVSRGMVIFGSADKNLYAVHADTGRKSWSFKASGAIHSSPCEDFGHVFVGADDGHLYAVKLSTGRKAWSVTTGAAIRSSPLIADDTIIAGNEDGLVIAVKMDGQSKWHFLAKRSVTSSPVESQGLVIVGSHDCSVYCIDADNGWTAWRFRTKKPVISSPAVSDETVYIGSVDGHLYALNLFTGQKRWSYDIGSQITSSPMVNDDAVYFGGIDGFVYSLEADSGQIRWRFQTSGPIPSSPACFEDIILIGSTDGHLYALPA
ncbi:MAG: serine/threonine-protein kinase [Chloroflexota bacterium]